MFDKLEKHKAGIFASLALALAMTAGQEQQSPIVIWAMLGAIGCLLKAFDTLYDEAFKHGERLANRYHA